MSISFRQIRKSSTAQGRFKDLVQEYQRSLAEQVTVDNPDFRVKLRTMYSKLTYKDPYVTHKTKPLTTVFYLPFEPDAKQCVGLWHLDHNGYLCLDASGRGHFGRWVKNPQVKEGIDIGFGTSLYADFNGTDIHAYMDDRPDLRLSFAPYFSITGRIYPKDISATDGPAGTKYRTIFSKADSITTGGGGGPATAGAIDTGRIGNGYIAAVTPDGKLRFTLMSGGIRYTVETLANVITAQDPPFDYDFTITCNQVDKRTIPAEQIVDPSDVPGADQEAFPDYPTPLIAPRIEISVNNHFYALYSTAHLSFADDSLLRLRIGTLYAYPADPTKNVWFRWKGGIQRLAFYNGRILTFPEIQNLHTNKITIAEMPLGSPALAGSVIVFDESIIVIGYAPDGFDEEGFMTGEESLAPQGFPGMDPVGFDPTGFDTLPITEQGTLQNGGFDPRGFSDQGFDTIPFSQS